MRQSRAMLRRGAAGRVAAAAIAVTGGLTAGSAIAASGGGGGLPQLTVETFPSQLFWLGVSFAVLYYVMRQKALPAIGDVLAERQRTIDDHLDRARDLSDQAERVRVGYEAGLADARTAAQQVMAEARTAMAAETARRDAAFAETLAARTRDSEGRIAEVRQQAKETAEAVAVTASQLVADRVAGVAIDTAAAKAAVTSVLAGRD